MSSTPFDRFFAPAEPRAQLWRIALGVVLVLIIVTLGTLGVALAGSTLLARFVTLEEIIDGITPIGLYLVLFSFIFMAGGVALVVKFLHRIPARTLFGDRTRLWRDFFAFVGVYAVFWVVLAFIPVPGIEYNWNPSIGAWALFVPLALPLILLQTGAEEMVFRGYLQQQLAARFGAKAWIAWLLVPALLFAAAHSNPEGLGVNLWPTLAVLFLFGAIAADMTARTGSLGAAWGFHFANNTAAILLVSLDGPLSGLSLITLNLTPDDPLLTPYLAVNGAFLAVIYGVWRWRHG